MRLVSLASVALSAVAVWFASDKIDVTSSYVDILAARDDVWLPFRVPGSIAALSLAAGLAITSLTLSWRARRGYPFAIAAIAVVVIAGIVIMRSI